MALIVVFLSPWLSCLLLLIMSFGSGECVEVTVSRDPVMQQKGLNVDIPCHYKTSVDSSFMLEWRFAADPTAPDNGKQILYFANGKVYKLGSQAERLSLLQDPPTLGDASIRINNIRPSDAGTYICEVNNPPDFYGNGFGLVNLTVLMPPSTPICKGTTSAPVGSDATFSCSSSEGVPTPTYSWTWTDSKKTLPLTNMVQNQAKGSLLLNNLTLQFSGTYVCVAANEFGHRSCQVALRVTGTGQAGTVAAALIGAILVLLLLGALVLFALRYRKKVTSKKPHSEYSGNEIREDATAPGISESLQRKDSNPESQLLRNISSRTGSASTTKSQLKNLIV